MDINSAVKPTAEIIDKIKRSKNTSMEVYNEKISKGVKNCIKTLNQSLESGTYEIRNGQIRIFVDVIAGHKTLSPDQRDLISSMNDVERTIFSVVKTIFTEAGWEIGYLPGGIFLLEVKEPEPAPLSFWEFIRGKWR